MSLAILFGLLAVFAGGGLNSASGCLNAILIGKFLLIGIAIKIVLLQPTDSTLIAPRTTALVMAIGFAGLFAGTLIQSQLYCPQTWSMNQPFSDSMLLAFSIVLFVLGYLGYFAAMIPSTQGEGLQTGGWIGIARILGSLKSLSIVPALLYFWRRDTRRWLTHPVIIGVLLWCTAVGIFSTTKQDAMEPLAFYAFVGFLRYGCGDLRLWSLVSLGSLYFALVVFPYSQYIRNAGGREGTFEHRAEVTLDAFLRMNGSQEFRSTVTERVSKGPSFFERPELAPFTRLAMVGDADKLISATEQKQEFTGWETITWGFKLMTPSFLYPDKPVFEAGNYLGRIGGEINPSDKTTQISYGVMANFYNAFSFSGVAIGTTLFFGAFYYWIRLFLGDARSDGMPTTSTLWFIWLIASFQHSIVESSLPGVVASLAFPVVIAMVYVLAKLVCMFLPQELAQI
jgi:hypothetical protein